MQGQSSDMEITVRQIIRTKKNSTKFMSEAHRKDIRREIDRDSNHDYWMKAEEAGFYGSWQNY
jgi:ATP-dependent protease ClpP protease subunit